MGVSLLRYFKLNKMKGQETMLCKGICIYWYAARLPLSNTDIDLHMHVYIYIVQTQQNTGARNVAPQDNLHLLVRRSTPLSNTDIDLHIDLDIYRRVSDSTGCTSKHHQCAKECSFTGAWRDPGPEHIYRYR